MFKMLPPTSGYKKLQAKTPMIKLQALLNGHELKYFLFLLS
jgi:hypothetical protein